jgi:hypothetical protein
MFFVCSIDVKPALQPTQEIGRNPGTFIDGGGTETAIAT